MKEKAKCGCGRKKPTGKGVKTGSTLARQSGCEVPSDVQGSYTGSPVADDHPVQDADDL